MDQRIDFDATDARPVRRLGLVESAGRTVGASAMPVVRTFGLAAASLAGVLGGDDARDRVFQAVDETMRSMRDYYEPAPDEEMSTAGQIAGGVASMPIEVVGGMGVQRGVDRAAEVVQRGGSLQQAATAGATTGGVNLALNMLPVKAGGRVAQALESKVGGMLAGGATGAAINVPAQVAATAAENVALPAREDASLVDRATGHGAAPEFRDMARDPLDKRDLAVGAGLAAAFGAAGGRAGRARREGGREAARSEPASFDDAVQSGQLRPAELSDSSGYLTPNGAFITRADWDGASERVRSGWMRAGEAAAEHPEGVGRGEAEIEAPPPDAGPARGHDAAGPDVDEPARPGSEPERPSAPDDAAQGQTPRERELERLRGRTTDAAVIKDLDVEIAAERQREVARKRGEEFLRLAGETKDPELRSRLRKRAAQLGVKAEALPVGEASELVGSDAAAVIREAEQRAGMAGDAAPLDERAQGRVQRELPELSEQKLAEWQQEHGFGDLDARAARSVARALQYDSATVERAVQQHRRSPRAFEREIQHIIDEGEQHASQAQQTGGGGEGLA